jgi:Ran GTPase-activating protein (RanGAP) involved in mRNA processing and transport
MNLTKLNFIAKYVLGNKNISQLNLSNNGIDQKLVRDLKQMIEETDTLKILDLSGNKIKGHGLNTVCSAVC